jgi:hypothetical protein
MKPYRSNSERYLNWRSPITVTAVEKTTPTTKGPVGIGIEQLIDSYRRVSYTVLLYILYSLAAGGYLFLLFLHIFLHTTTAALQQPGGFAVIVSSSRIDTLITEHMECISRLWFRKIIFLLWALQCQSSLFVTDMMTANQLKLSSTINDTLWNFQFPSELRKISQLADVSELCTHRARIQDRVGCCNPSDFRKIYNVKISNGNMIIHGDKGSTHTMPTITSLKLQNPHPFNMGVRYTDSRFSRFNCSRVFEGTLHVIPRRTANKLYHASKTMI